MSTCSNGSTGTDTLAELACQVTFYAYRLTTDGGFVLITLVGVEPRMRETLAPCAPE